MSSLFSRLKIACADAVDTFSSSFTGANESGTRTSTIATPIDTRKEITHYTRLQLIKKSRWCENQLGVIRRFFRGVARFTVGGGISHVPATRDPEWNELSDNNFTEWASNEQLCDVRGRLTFWRMENKALCWMFRDGDVFALKAPLKNQFLANGREIPGYPQLQLIESHICSSNPYNSLFGEVDEENYRDGVLFSAFGRPLKYRFMVDKDPKMQDLSGIVTRPAEDVMHVLDDERATQCRGLPWMYHGLNSAIDIIDLVALEKAAVKVHSALSGAIRTRKGEAGRGFTGDLTPIKGKTADNRNKVTAYENFAGGAGILNLGLDEEFQLYTSNRPSVTFGGFIDYLVRDMAWGFGVSPEFIWSVAGLSGPNARVILEDAKWLFEELQDLLVSLLLRKTYTWVTARAMARGELRACRDPRWWICDWIGPQKITIDQGREGQLELDRLNMACGTWEGYWAARGKSGKKMVERRIDEIAAAMKYAQEKKVPFDYVLPLKPGAVAPESSDDDEGIEPPPANGNGRTNGNAHDHLTSILTTRI